MANTFKFLYAYHHFTASKYICDILLFYFTNPARYAIDNVAHVGDYGFRM